MAYFVTFLFQKSVGVEMAGKLAQATLTNNNAAIDI